MKFGGLSEFLMMDKSRQSLENVKGIYSCLCGLFENIFKWVVPQITNNNINYNLLFYTVSKANSRILAKITFMLCCVYVKQVEIIVKLFSLR